MERMNRENILLTVFYVVFAGLGALSVPLMLFIHPFPGLENAPYPKLVLLYIVGVLIGWLTLIFKEAINEIWKK